MTLLLQTMAHPPVNPLIASLASGRPEAFAALYDHLAPALLRVAQAMLQNPADAEDVVQDLFVELARRRDGLLRVLDLDAYVFAMLRNAASRRIHRAASERRAMRQLLAATASPSQPAQAADDLSAALDRLPAEQREVIALKIDGRLTFAQIGEVLNISPNTAASRYRYAIEKLRQMMEST